MIEVTKSRLIGTWRLVSFESRDESGETRHPLGKNALGQITYGPDGRMSAILVQQGRLPFASGDMRRGTDAEVRSALEGFIGYFGTYSVDAAAGTVTHHVQGASFPNWIGGDQVRFYELEGTRLSLSTPPFLYDGQSSRSVLIWERCGGVK
jgi:Lipocalin-like domain